MSNIFVILSFMTLVVYIAFIIFRRRDIHQVAIAAAALLVTVLLWDWLSTSHDQTSPPRPPPPPPQAETQTQTQPQPQPQPPPPLEDIFSRYADRFAQLPQFDLPAPTPSATAVLSQSAFAPRPANLFELHERILKALNECGYFENAFYYVPRGFALVTRIEQIDDVGAPLEGRHRWDVNLITGMRKWTLAEYLRVLFLAPSGRYRIIVLIISPLDFPKSDVIISRDEAMKWFSLGPSYLPNVYEMVEFSDDYRVTALIYEFYVREQRQNKDAHLVRPSHILGAEHLAKSRISLALLPAVRR